MQRDEIHLRNILTLCNELDALITHVDQSKFIATDCIRSAALLKLIFIGEATRYLSDELRSSYPGIRWSRIVGFRNVTVHQYWEVDWAIVWSTANVDAPEYHAQVAAILEAEFPS